VRAAGEEQIKALEVTEEFGVHLAEFTVDPQGALAIRQLSSVLLKQYVEAHWSQLSEKFRPPETPEGAKAAIRQVLPMGLKESISKVRSSVAYAVSAIAHWDWPEAWPELFGILMDALTSGNNDAVHGAMRVLTEFCSEVTDLQMPQVAPVILPEMYKIFTQAEVYSIRTRSRAVDIFNTCACMIASINELNKGIAKQLLFPVLPQFTEAFVQSLQLPDGLTSDSGLKMEVLKAVTTLVKNFPGSMSQCLPQILPPVWNALTQSADIYIRTVVNNTDEADDPVDSDGEVLGFENLVYSVFDFIHALIDTPKYRSTVKKAIGDLLYYVILYMQITEDQERQWTANPDKFVEDEDDETFSYSVRISAQDLLLSLGSEFPKEGGPAVVAAVSRHLQEVEAAKNAGGQHWWKIHESVMLALGSIRTLIIDKVKENKIQFDIPGFLSSVVLQDLNLSCSPFLIGRCLWTASRYTEAMSPELVQRFLQATVGGLHPTQPPSVRISAIRAVYGFCEYLKTSDSMQIVRPFLPDILEGLLTVAQQFSSEVLALVLETLVIVVNVDKEFTASNEGKICPLTIAIFLKYSGDPMLVSLTQDIFQELSQNPGCIQSLHTRLLPTILSILQAPVERVPMGMHSVALDVLCTLVRGSPLPLPDCLMNQVFGAAIQCTLRTDDNSTMQSGGECLRAYVSVSLEQVIQWQDGQGNNGMYYIVQIISRLLDPKTSEFTASFVGRLVSIVISKMGNQLGENLDLILRAVLSKMQQAETLSVIQSLVMVFAHLMHSQMEAVLDFLSNVPGPTGKPALEFVLAEWCSKQQLFYGSYEGKVSSMALCKLLQHAIQSNDPRLQDIQVQGDPVYNTADGIRTRSKTSKAPDQWTTIPVLVKMYKLLINELSNQIESNVASEICDDDDDDEGDDDFDVGDEENGTDLQGQTLSSLLSQFAPASDYPGYDTVDDDDEDDPDAVNDPIYQVNLQAYLTEFLQSFSQQPCYSVFSAHHNALEKDVLHSVGIQA
jgi:hypothetical protein